MAEEKLRALAVGGQIAAQLIQTVYGEDVLIDTFDLKLPKEGRYDVVFIWNALQFIPYAKADHFLNDVRLLTKKGGFIYIYTTAMEWVAEQILKFDPTIPWRPTLFGSQKNSKLFTKNAFTMLDLRNLVETVGLHAVNAETGSYTLGEIKVGQHLVVCHIPKDDENAPVEDPPKRLRR